MPWPRYRRVPTKERPTLFKTMVGTLNHIYVVDLIWQAHLEGRDHGFKARNLVLHPALADLRGAQEAINAWFMAWTEAHTEATLNDRLPFVFISGKKGMMSRYDMLLHVGGHKSYHRGWTNWRNSSGTTRSSATTCPLTSVAFSIPLSWQY